MTAMIANMAKRNETPTARTNPGGKTVWVARWTDKTGKVRYGYKAAGIKGTHKLKRDAQAAINACYEFDTNGPARPTTIGAYFETWIDEHPRSEVTNRANASHIRATLAIPLEGVPFREWPFERLHREHANAIKKHLLVVDERARRGVNNILETLSVMVEDAIEDRCATNNPFRGMKKVALNDPRIRKAPRPIRVFSWEQMHAFARAAAAAPGTDVMVAWRRVHAEPMVRVMSDLGLRIGEVFPLHRTDLDVHEATLRVQRTVTQRGEILQGTKTDHGHPDAGRTVPVPPELLAMLLRMMMAAPPTRAPWLFPSPRGKLWFYMGFRDRVWLPAQEGAGIDIRPHECRHSWESLLLAAGIDPSDLAEVGGHTVETQTRTYRHALNRSADEIRKAVGA